MIDRPSFAEQCMVRIVCAIALLFVGFAHQPPTVNSRAIPLGEIALYTLPDGTLPVLCLAFEDGRGGKHDTHHGTGTATDCEACRLTAGLLLPAPADTLGQPILWQPVPAAALRASPFPRRIVHPNTWPRGPPAAVLA